MKNRLRRRAAINGFTLIEALIAIALMGFILATLATVTAQWLPNWNRGFVRAQRAELLSLGLGRIVADLAAAEFVPPNRTDKRPLFDGAELSVIFVRSALGPNTPPGLEVVRISETADEQGRIMVRTRAPFVPFDANAKEAPRFTDPVVLVRAPYRVSFAYAGPDRIWHDTWNGRLLPTAVRVLLRDAASERILSVSTSTTIHVNMPAECARSKDPSTCGTTDISPGETAPTPQGASQALGARP